MLTDAIRRGALLAALLCMGCIGAARATVAGLGTVEGATILPGLSAPSPCSHPRRVTALALGPRQQVLAGTVGNGLYVATTGRLCWTPVRSYPHADIDILLAPPGRPTTIIAATSNKGLSDASKGGMYRSETSGRTWAHGVAGLPHRAIVAVQLAASARTGTLVLAYTFADTCAQATPLSQTDLIHCLEGLARSTDGGRTWQPIGLLVNQPVENGVVALADGGFLAVQQAITPSILTPHPGADYRPGPVTVYHSGDDGRTWQPIWQAAATAPLSLARHFGGISSLYVAPWDDWQVFIGADKNEYGALAYRSLDGGRHWSRPWSPSGNTSSDGPRYVNAFAGLTRTRTLLLSTHKAIYRSTDGGATWANSSTGLGADPGVWTLLSGGDGATAYAGTEMGVYRSSDDGRTWHAASS